MFWNPDDLVESVAGGLRAASREADLEQAVRGVDALDELRLHPLIRDSLEEAGLGVWTEVRYPGDRSDGRRNRGRRCDVVLTPARRDPVGEEDPPASSAGAPTTDPAPPDRAGPLPPVSLADAYWMEVKAATQFSEEGPHRGYSQRLLQAASGDILKMSQDPLIVHGGLLLVVFARDPASARHDLAAWHLRCLEKDYPLGYPSVTGFTLADRLGNGHAAVALFPVR